MRTIKFRAWDKEYKEILPMDLFKEEWLDMDDYWETMQFIGLPDINGKDIYEGDILKIRDVSFGYEYIGVINYDNDSYSYLIGIIDGGETMPKCKHGVSFLKMHHSFEVIGNIYENKDYLKHYAK